MLVTTRSFRRCKLRQSKKTNRSNYGALRCYSKNKDLVDLLLRFSPPPKKTGIDEMPKKQIDKDKRGDQFRKRNVQPREETKYSKYKHKQSGQPYQRNRRGSKGKDVGDGVPPEKKQEYNFDIGKSINTLKEPPAEELMDKLEGKSEDMFGQDNYYGNDFEFPDEGTELEAEDLEDIVSESKTTENILEIEGAEEVLDYFARTEIDNMEKKLLDAPQISDVQASIIKIEWATYAEDLLESIKRRQQQIRKNKEKIKKKKEAGGFEDFIKRVEADRNKKKEKRKLMREDPDNVYYASIDCYIPKKSLYNEVIRSYIPVVLNNPHFNAKMKKSLIQKFVKEFEFLESRTEEEKQYYRDTFNTKKIRRPKNSHMEVLHALHVPGMDHYWENVRKSEFGMTSDQLSYRYTRVKYENSRNKKYRESSF
eukprot:TRINITY_DN4545_c0_g1_i1.p1 TRINITY_DN4545_c0_g1~~TRINITY_DN4545_c0_g1_i1.p1  ORF type:complete len:423 (-),score=114.97 TRINITY_DN4545_c0_g1_i1:75-1343(-)